MSIVVTVFRLVRARVRAKARVRVRVRVGAHPTPKPQPEPSPCVARVLDRFVEDPAQEDLERATRLRVDVTALVTSHSLHAAAPRQPADGLLGYPLRRIPQRTPRAHRDAADRSVSRADLARLCIVRVSLAAAPV